MTLEEKVGQLNQDGSSPMEGKGESADDNIRAGRVGTLLGVHGTSRCNHLQKVAVEESRLGIPLLFGMDVIHGHRTIFPIPLAESCSWDEELFEKTAQVSALEAAVAGIN